MYPAGTRADVYADGMTYVALVPFAMKTAVGTSLPLPYFGTFLETTDARALDASCLSRLQRPPFFLNRTGPGNR